MVSTGKRSNSVKVFSALTWSWSSKSLNHTKDIVDFADPSEACKPGSHCITLRKLCDEEHKLYKEVKVSCYVTVIRRLGMLKFQFSVLVLECTSI